MKDTGLARYFIAIIPPSPFREEAQRLKREAAERFQTRAALRSPPHITLHMPFLRKEKKEEELCKTLADFAGQQQVMTITFTTVGCFKPRVIFVDVLNTPELISLQEHLHRFCKQRLQIFNASRLDQPFKPHLTVAFRDLKKNMFEPAWNFFSQQTFAGQFEATSMWLLKHNGKEWELYRDFEFGA
jgi:2'-5' RNA ligase